MRGGSIAVDRWSSRKVQPIVVLYVLAVFAVFIALSHFVIQSAAAVKALALAAVGAVAVTIPGVLGKVEYQATEAGVERRTVNEKEPGGFEGVFRWDELSHVVPMRHGFKYYKTLHETNPFRRFWKLHLSDAFSGEIHVEKKDLERIMALVDRRGVEIS
jgi:hypothetical protein